jgi:hypothetical protein
MVKSQKWTFFYALVLTLVVFNFGIFMGYMLEQSRINKVNTWYLEAEMDLLDLEIQKDAFDLMDLNCDILVEENIKFADKIYESALVIEKYEKASRINSEIIFQHKRFDLLRTLLWINSIKIKESCNSSYHNVVYFYQYNEPSIEQKSKQRVFSNFLYEVKQERGGEIMLIPIAGDNNHPSINILLDKYNIEEFPVILIDEKFKISDIEKLEEIDNFLE